MRRGYLPYQRTLWMILSLALSACRVEQVDSEDVLTSGMHAEIWARAVPGQTTVTVILRVGGSASNTYVDLRGEDALFVTVDGEETRLSQRSLALGKLSYEATLDEYPGDTDIVVSLERAVDDGAADSVVSLPEQFEIVEPAASESFSRSTEDLTLRWDPAGEEAQMTWSASGSCINSLSDKSVGSSNTDHVVIPAGTLVSRTTPQSPQGTTCAVSLGLIRERDGNLDAGFGEGGYIRSSRAQTISFTSEP